MSTGSTPSDRKRLDQIVLERGWAESRNQAKALILAGLVSRGSERLIRPGIRVQTDIDLRLQSAPRFVGRAGEKLDAFINQFDLRVAGLDVLDVGASTGGFTDCLLRRGIASATCIDVGRAQLHPRIAGDPRVTNIQQINARTLISGDLPRGAYDLIVVDVSFISLRQIFRPVWSFLKPGGLLIALVKPQFEAGREAVRKGRGVIRNEAIQKRVFQEIRSYALMVLDDCLFFGEMPSPLIGGDGNREQLQGFCRGVAERGSD